MAFTPKGYLEPGLHDMKLDQVEHEFVSLFPHSSTRPNIVDGYKKHADAIKKLVGSYLQFIDGSFVTNKNDPGDIDLVCFIDGDAVDALPPPDQQKIAELLCGPGAKASYMCDAYFCASYPDTHPKYGMYRSSRKYWMGEFGFDRSDVPKGIVVITEETTAAPAAGAMAPALGGGP